jgi:predicted Rdx family selenoprotein
MNNK